ncbi:hypothetical protein NDU88_005746 [Pleurodeles waltl]|uniref:Reverse transcriptase domain-containing protein n=1 Tax=Pleurodeles waltl TaxID=8319 RepID=A0AAV7QIR6_PLEWA|nr:hypothetical protein NDU88_005746 [Pleurodeles waltl]
MYSVTCRFRSLVQENLEASQEDLKCWYDQNATLVEFQPGQKVWVMAPVETGALQDKWTGPFEVVEHKSEVTYLVSKEPFKGVTHLCTHDVDTGDSRPIIQKVYRMTDRVRACIKDEISKMLALRVIQHSISPWASPVVLVPKAAAPGATPELRFFVDYRGLNAVSKIDAHLITRADELIDRLGAAKYLNTLDLTSGYWQIALTEGAKERSEFSTPDGHFQFKVMPF